MLNQAANIFLLIYLLTILLASLEMVPLSVASLIGGLLALYFGLSYDLFTYEEAIGFIDIRLLGLIVGIMIVFEVAERSGMFQIASLYAIRIARGDPVKMFFSICFVSAAVSMFLSDVTAMILIAAAAGTIARVMKYDPIPYFVSASIMVNLGGTSTLIGSISNMIIGVSSSLSFTDFVNYLTLGEIFLWILTSVTLYFLYRSRLGEKKPPPKYNPWEGIENRKGVYKSLFVTVLFLLLFFIYDNFNIGPEAVALGCAILALAISDVDPAEIFRRIDWETVFFIGGFFIIVSAVERVGLLDSLSHQIFNVAEGSSLKALFLTLWSSGLISVAISNIAVALTFVPVIRGLQGLNQTALWSALVFGTNLGGAATPLSGTVCILAIGALKKEGIKLNFTEFTKPGLLTTIIQLGFSTIYLILRFGIWS
jgi:Na+/H+ antiporter NhaD/arsenite permease-like protein